MRLMTTNFATEPSTSITASSENVNFPASNLKHPFRSKRLRTETGVTSLSVVFDLKTAEEIDSVVLLWPKEDGIRLSNTATITVQANATDEWSSPAVSETLSIDNTYVLASHFFSQPKEYRYWRVVIDDPGNPYGFVELGLVWLGKGLPIDNMQNGFKFELVDASKTTRTEFGHEFVDEYPLYASIEFSYANMDYDQIEILDNAFRENSVRKPVLIVVDPSEAVFSSNHFLIYGKFSPRLGIGHVNYDIMNAEGLRIVELS